MKISFSLLLLFMISLVGCVPLASSATDKPVPSPSYEINVTMTAPVTSNTPDPLAQELVIQAQTLLARKLSLETKDIFLFDVKSIEWPDASLGCPQAGMSYAQVVTPGYQILLEANGQVYTFHTDTTSRVILCEAQGPDEIYLPP